MKKLFLALGLLLISSAAMALHTACGWSRRIVNGKVINMVL